MAIVELGSLLAISNATMMSSVLETAPTTVASSLVASRVTVACTEFTDQVRGGFFSRNLLLSHNEHEHVGQRACWLAGLAGLAGTGAVMRATVVLASPVLGATLTVTRASG